jgi:hypothetical protein
LLKRFFLYGFDGCLGFPEKIKGGGEDRRREEGEGERREGDQVVASKGGARWRGLREIKKKGEGNEVVIPRTNFKITTVHHSQRIKHVVPVWPLTLLPPQICTGKANGSGTTACTRTTSCPKVIRDTNNKNVS